MYIMVVIDIISCLFIRNVETVHVICDVQTDIVDIQTIELDGNRCQRECYGLIGWNTYRKGNIYKFKQLA